MSREIQAALACPFCGSADIGDGEVLAERENGTTFKQSQCNGCGAFGPEADVDGPDYGDVKAIAAWNRRATLPPPADGAVALVELLRQVTRNAELGHYRDPESWIENTLPHIRQAANLIERHVTRQTHDKGDVVAWIPQDDLVFVQGGSYRQTYVYSWNQDERVPLYAAPPADSAMVEALRDCVEILENAAGKFPQEDLSKLWRARTLLAGRK